MNSINNANNASKSNATSVKAKKPLSEGQMFFKGTIALAIESLDISRTQALAFTRNHSVTKLAGVISVAKVLSPEMMTTMLNSKRGVDHVRNWFSPRQINDLKGPRNILNLASHFFAIRKEAQRLAEKAAADAKAKAAAKAEAEALATQPIAA